jgi:hypothetical protein
VPPEPIPPRPSHSCSSPTKARACAVRLPRPSVPCHPLHFVGLVPAWARNPQLLAHASQRTVRACACVAGRSEVHRMAFRSLPRCSTSAVPCDATAGHSDPWHQLIDHSVIWHRQMHHRRDFLPHRREPAALTAWHRKLGRLDGDQKINRPQLCSRAAPALFIERYCTLDVLSSSSASGTRPLLIQSLPRCSCVKIMLT